MWEEAASREWGGRGERDTEHEATVSMFVLFLRSGGSVCGRDAARPVADAHRCAGANEGWAQGGAPHGQVGQQLVSILLCRREREKKKRWRRLSLAV